MKSLQKMFIHQYEYIDYVLNRLSTPKLLEVTNLPQIVNDIQIYDNTHY